MLLSLSSAEAERKESSRQCCSVTRLINLPSCTTLPDGCTGTGKTVDLKNIYILLIINIIYQIHIHLLGSLLQRMNFEHELFSRKKVLIFRYTVIFQSWGMERRDTKGI